MGGIALTGWGEITIRKETLPYDVVMAEDIVSRRDKTVAIIAAPPPQPACRWLPRR